MTDDDDDLLDRPVDLGFLPKLWPYVRPYRRAFGGCLLLLLLSFGVEMAGPWILRHAIDGPMRDGALDQEARIQELWGYAALFLGVVALGTVLGWLYGRLTAWNGQRVIRDVRRQLFTHLLQLSPAFFDRNAAGKLTTRVTSDVENLNELIATGVLQSLFDLLKIGGVLVALFLLDVRLALFTVATTPVVIGLSLLFRRNAQRAYRAVRGKLALLNAYTAEAIGGVRATRAYGREHSVSRRYAQLNADTALAWRDTVFHFSVFFALVDLALRATSIGLLWFGGSAVLAGDAAPGEFVQFWLYFGLLTSPIKELGEKYNVLQAAFASTERIFAILGQPHFPPPRPAAEPAPSRAVAATDGRGLAVEFDLVTFGYHQDAPVLRELSFRIAPATTVAVVGPTGAGKTTLLSLVSRLRDVDQGRVLVGGRDVRELDITTLRRQVAVVAQDVFLFTGSVLDNVRLFDRRIGEQRVWQSLETVGAAEFVRALPQGLLTKMQERGATLSQGQRQLLAFARALVTDPAVLVLDEATASIDSASEARLQQALQAALRGRTALVVAHRLSTVRNSDRILVLQQGRIVEAGAHRDLLAQNGHYAAMVRNCSAVDT